ncbi:MAG: TraR/DksA family transcriptional regulator [Candidatus Methylomirabilia bacterium]
MKETQAQLERELRQTMARLKQLGGAVVLEDLPGAIGDISSLADSLDTVQVCETREIGFATRSLLVERANKLSEALDRLRYGVYGVCQECEEPIAPARLCVMPEVTTCVRCQDRLERRARWTERTDSVFATTEDEEPVE